MLSRTKAITRECEVVRWNQSVKAAPVLGDITSALADRAMPAVFATTSATPTITAGDDDEPVGEVGIDGRCHPSVPRRPRGSRTDVRYGGRA